MSDSANGMFEAALRYLSIGWSPIPLAPFDDSGFPQDRRGKQPLLKGWQRFSKKLPSEEQIKSWWRQWPNANVGIACGPASGILVLDVDGEEGLASLKGKSIPITPRVRTGSGGVHLYFLHPEGNRVKNGVKILPGLDIRTTGGQCAAPPSIHPNGKAYQWEVTPTEESLAEAPSWLLDLAGENHAPRRKPVRTGCSVPWLLCRTTRDFLAVGADQGERNNRLFRAACDMCGCGFALSEAEPMLLAGAERCRPPMNPQAALRTIASAYSRKRSPARPKTHVNREEAGMPDQTTVPADFLDVKECAAYLKVKESTIRAYVSEGRIPYHKLPGSNKVLFDIEDLRGWVRSGRVETREEYLKRITDRKGGGNGRTEEESG